MPRRCTLVSPTNLIEESEFLLFGRKEFDRILWRARIESRSAGVLLGFLGATLVMLAAAMWAPK